MRRPRFSPFAKIALPLASVLALTLAACGGGGPANPEEEARTLRRGISANPDSLDPHRVSSQWENIIIGDMMMGLFTDSAAGKPVPAMAENWKVSEDGLVWTFRLREGLKWSDGVPLTAQDFVFSFRRLQDASLGGQYASMLHLIKNARQVNEGILPPEEMGVRAIDDLTLEITLEYPAPYLPGLLKHYASFPVPQHVVEEFGLQWTRPENIVVNGPYKLVSWRIGDSVIVERNPNWYGDEAGLCFDKVVYYPYTDLDAVERFIETGRLDINNAFAGQKKTELDRRFPGWVRTSPSVATTYWSFQMEKAPFDDVRVREALSLALDREFMVGQVLTPGFIPAYSLVPPGIDNYRTKEAQVAWADMPREERLVRARTLLEAAGFGPNNPLRFTYIYRATSDNPKVAPVADSNWRDIAPWVQPSIELQDTKVLYERLRQKNFEVADGAWIADYNDPYNFLYLLDSRTGQQNYSNYANREYDAKLDQANQILDLDARANLMIEAEQMMLDDFPITPMWFQVNQNLVDPTLTGWEENAEDRHRSQYFCRAELERRPSPTKP